MRFKNLTDRQKMYWYSAQGGGGVDLTNAIFYSDGTTSGSQLTDLSGNDNHGIVTDNLVTDSSFEYGSVMSGFGNGSFDTIENSTEQAHTGTKSCKLVVASASGSVTGATLSKTFRVKPGETVNWSFWVYRVTGSDSFDVQIVKGDGTAGTSLFNQTPTYDQWVEISGSFTDAVGGNNATMRLYVNAGEDLTAYVDDFSYTIDGESNLGIIMADDAAMKAADENNLFYTSGGIPITNRTDIGDPTLNNELIFNGGEFSYLFLSSAPGLDQLKTIHASFVDHDWVFDSCENVLTVGSGKDYADVQSAIDAISGDAIDNRFRIEIYDDITASVTGDYGKSAGGGFYYIFQCDEKYVYFDGIGEGRKIEATLPETASDNDMTYYAPVDLLYSGGMRNLTINKTNGRYAIHIDASSLAEQDLRFYNCTFNNYGIQEVVDYRVANTLPEPAGVGVGGITPVGMGMHEGLNVEFANCSASGIHALTNHSDISTGDKAYMYFYNFILTAVALYHPAYNPTSTLQESIRVDGTADTVKSDLYIMRSTLNNGIESTSSWNIYQ